MAKELKDKSYLLSFNLFTELGVEICSNPLENNRCKPKDKLETVSDNNIISILVARMIKL